MNVLYLVHDLADAAVEKRVRMLRDGGANVNIMGFRRQDEVVDDIAGQYAVDLGRTYNANFVQRITMVAGQALGMRQHLTLFEEADVVIARNLEMLALAVRGRDMCKRSPVIVYELLDIHRFLLGDSPQSKALRALEGRLCQDVSLVITSSPAFISDYIEKRSKINAPHMLLENKVYMRGAKPKIPTGPKVGSPWIIGWFGMLRCRKSFEVLAELARQSDGAIEVLLRGKPALDEIPDFHETVEKTPGMRYEGAYQNPHDLAQIYGSVHFTWAIDMYEEGLNSSWLLPNRLYEGGAYGSVPLALRDVETGRFLENLKLGVLLDQPLDESLKVFFDGLDSDQYEAHKEKVKEVKKTQWVFDKRACKALVKSLYELMVHEDDVEPVPDKPDKRKVLAVIPCLNEEEHIAAVVQRLVDTTGDLDIAIAVVDGGSDDKTVLIAEELAQQYKQVHLLHNSKKIQSAAINLAVEELGTDADVLIRLDAHAEYPDNYCQILLQEQREMDAASVVVPMDTVGKSWFQKAVATAQNSKLGNGGSAHRSVDGRGEWVDHGHHALMSVSAFRDVSGYDETFSHNEDAELDIRLGQAGHQIWLTGRTELTYYPRSEMLALARQYFNFGRGRAKTVFKHRIRPKLRQMLPLAVAPALCMLVFEPFFDVMSVPASLWMWACLLYGLVLGVKEGALYAAFSGVPAMIMHAAWSFGFWREVVSKLMDEGRWNEG